MSNAARTSLAAVLVAVLPSVAYGAAGNLRSRVIGAFNGVRSYKLTVLGNVRSTGVFVKPNRYQMTTILQGKPIKTIIVGQNYWIYSNGKWQKSGNPGNSLKVDIAGLIANAKTDPGIPFVAKPDQVQDGKKVGTFGYTFRDGTQEMCNYDPPTYRVTRCKAEELTLLYSGYNDRANTVANPR